jgi:hypothetical protein
MKCHFLQVTSVDCLSVFWATCQFFGQQPLIFGQLGALVIIWVELPCLKKTFLDLRACTEFTMVARSILVIIHCYIWIDFEHIKPSLVARILNQLYRGLMPQHVTVAYYQFI